MSQTYEAYESLNLTCDMLSFEGATSRIPVHVIVVNVPSAWQVAAPEPVYPGLQLTVTLSPVTPVMLPVADLSECSTLVGEQGLAVTIRKKNHVSICIVGCT